MTRKHMVIPPFRDLDPELAVAESLLAQGESRLTWVATALPDEEVAARRLNVILAHTDAAPRLVPSGNGWRVVQVTASPDCGELVAGASGVAGLVAFGEWRRVGRCVARDRPFCDRTAGCSRRWCDEHRPHADPWPCVSG